MKLQRIAPSVAGLLLIAVGVGGRAATAPLTLSVAGRANSNVSLAASGSFVAAVWSASLPSGETDIFAATSRDGAATFSAPVRVNSTPGEASVNGEQPPRVALRARAGAPEMAVVWTAKGSAGTRLLVSRSTDGGRTFAPSVSVPGSDAPGARGWEAIGVGPGDHFFSVWLDHRRMAEPQRSTQPSQTRPAGHQHNPVAPATTAAAAESVAAALRSELYVASLDGTVAPRSVTAGVCYCCKTAIARGPGEGLYLAWRHVYENSMRDIAFSASRDGGRTFSPPVRVSADQWQINGCPDDGPSMVVDREGIVHVVWPSVVDEQSGPVKALFHASSRDGLNFAPRQRIPTEGQANHPQLAVDTGGTLAVVWDESGTGTRRLAWATGRRDAAGRMQFARATTASGEVGSYPNIVSLQTGVWLTAWTSGASANSAIKLGRTP